jgi:ApaG protein
VVGQQPFLSPVGSHQYTSWCNLRSDIGMMRGAFRMYNHLSKEFFEVYIPNFQLIAPMRLN